MASRSPDLVGQIPGDGRGPVPGHHHGTGHGSGGMWMARCGGELRTGRRPGGGFRVSATIPVEPTTTSQAARVGRTGRALRGPTRVGSR